MASSLRGSLQARWAVRITTFVLWALAIFSVTQWALRTIATPSSVSQAPAVLRTPAPVNSAAVATLLGASSKPVSGAPAQPDLASRFVLTGVVADRTGGGAALIAVDGRPPRPYRVGSALDEGLMVQAVEGRRVMVGAELGGAHAVVLELPPLLK